MRLLSALRHLLRSLLAVEADCKKKTAVEAIRMKGWRIGAFGCCLAVAAWLQGSPLAEEDSASQRLTIFFSSNVSGTFEPCGCKAHPAGGLARRAGYVHSFGQQSKDWVMEIDLGNYFEMPGPHAEAVNQLLLESLQEFPIQVMNLASDDLHFWPTLHSKASATQVISANLKPRRSSVPQPKPYAIVQVPAAELGLSKDLRIGFLGVTDPSLVKPNSGMKGTDPLTAVQSVKKTVLEKEGADFLILLTDLPRHSSQIESGSLLYELAQQNPEVAAILNTERRYILFPPQMVNNAVILSGVERGRHLSRLTLTLDESGQVQEIDHDTVELKEGIPEDDTWRAKQDALRIFVQ